MKNPTPMAVMIMMFRSNIGMIVRIAVTKGDEGRC